VESSKVLAEIRLSSVKLCFHVGGTWDVNYSSGESGDFSAFAYLARGNASMIIYVFVRLLSLL
jgi:hypothetical protein